MATNTYVALKTTIVSGSASTVTLDLTGISGYTDLVLVASARGSYADSLGIMKIQFNSDTGSNYSMTQLYGSGSGSGTSARVSNQTSFGLEYVAGNNETSGVFPIVVGHIQNFSNTTTYKTALFRTSNAGVRVVQQVGTWRSTNAITSISITEVLGSTWAIGSTFTVYGIANADNFTKATGGIISEDSTYTYHVFGSSGTFTPKQSLTADILVVAGGGGGGSEYAGAGGAGGIVYHASRSLTSGTPLTVTVGAGAATGGTAPSMGTAGSNSVFDTITALGGGAGGYWNTSGFNGGNGGSGGGGGMGTSNGNTTSGGSATQGTSGGGTGYGNAGGGGLRNGSYYLGGGGGGAGSAGSAASGTAAGAGGAGLNTWSSWLSATSLGVDGYIAGGGGGSAELGTNGAGGSGGGGAGGLHGTTPNGTAGRVNTGSGGGGGSGNAGLGGAGGSGLVIVRYAK